MACLLQPRASIASLAMLLVASVVLGAGPARGATSSTVVGAHVPSATQLDVSGCLPGVPGRTDLGLVMPGASAVTTDDCTIAWGSSNDSASLRVADRDGGGTTMNGLTTGGLDPVFAGGSGVATLDLGGTDAGESMTILQDGSLLVGTARGTRIGLARF